MHTSSRPASQVSPSLSLRSTIVTLNEPAVARVGPASYLTLHYRVSLTSEAAIDTDIVNTFDDNPATLQLGMGQLSEALEAKLIGLTNGDYAVFDLAAGEAFGPRNPDLVQKLSRSAFDIQVEEAASYQAGDLIAFTGPNGGSYSGVLKDINAQYALFDFNHPLAGQPVRFEVKIIGVL